MAVRVEVYLLSTLRLTPFCHNKIPTVAITLVLGRSSWSPMLVRVTNLVERAGKHILCHTTLWWQHSVIRCNDPDSGCLALTEDVSDVLCYCQQGGNLVPNNVPCVKGQEPYIMYIYITVLSWLSYISRCSCDICDTACDRLHCAGGNYWPPLHVFV